MGKFTSETAREMQERSVLKRKENRPDKDAVEGSLHNVVEEITTPCESLKAFAQRVKDKKDAAPLERIYYNLLNNPKTAKDALKDILDRVLGKPKQAEPTKIDITTGGQAFTGFSSVLPSMPHIEEICADIDAQREQNTEDE